MLPPTDPTTDQARQRALTRMKWIATGLLVLMSVVFVLTYVLQPTPTWLGYVRAFAEAAMIGALADWFAVTALFRHPFGIPIPHTAIIPRRKDQIGESLARFVKQNFLTPEVLSPKLAAIDFGRRIGDWLAREQNAARLGADAGALLIWLLDSIDNETVRKFLGGNLKLSLREVPITPLLARAAELITAEHRHQELIDVAVRVAREQLDENRARIRSRIGRNSPWWLPEFVDEEIYDKFVYEIEALLNRIGYDPNHEARRKFNQATEELIASLANDPDLIARGEKIKDDILNHPSVQNYLTDSWERLRGYLRDEIGNPDSPLQQRLARGLQRFGERLSDDEAMRAQVSAWVRDALTYAVDHYRDQISSVIHETVRAWDAEATSRRIELQVGRDLQFIRVNGTLVGGLAGLLIHTIVGLF